MPDAIAAMAANVVSYFFLLAPGWCPDIHLEVLGSLSEYQLTGRRQKIQFTESAYEGTYRYHLKSIADARATAPTTVAQLMHEMYMAVM